MTIATNIDVIKKFFDSNFYIKLILKMHNTCDIFRLKGCFANDGSTLGPFPRNDVPNLLSFSNDLYQSQYHGIVTLH